MIVLDVCLKLTTGQADAVPDYLRRMFGLPEFKTKSARMGKVALASARSIQYYSVEEGLIHILGWPLK